MGIKFIGDRTKVITKDTSVNKTGLMLRRRAAIIQQIINGTATITPAADYYTKMLLHFDDTLTSNTGAIAFSASQTPQMSRITPDMTKLVCGMNSGGGIEVIDTTTNTKITSIPSSTIVGNVKGIVFNSVGTKMYVSAYDTSTSTGRLYTINMADYGVINTQTLINKIIEGIDISPDDKFVYAVVRSQLIHAMDTVTYQITTSGLHSNISDGKCIAISPDGSRLLFGSTSQVYIYSRDVANGNLTYITNSNTADGNFGADSCAKTSKYVFFLHNSGQKITRVSWDLCLQSNPQYSATHQIYNGVQGFYDTDIAVSPDGKKLFAGTGLSGVWGYAIIDVETATVVTTINDNSNSLGIAQSRFAATNEKVFISSQYFKKLVIRDIRSFSDVALSPLTQHRIFTGNTSVQSKFGGKSLTLGGVNIQKLQFANPKGKAMDFANKPFCVEGWFYLTSGNNSGLNAWLLGYANTDSGDCQGIGIHILNSTNNFAVYMSTNGTTWDLGAPTISTSVAPTLNTWFHIALVRETSGGDIKLVYNGTVIGTKSTTASLYTGDYLYIGRSNATNATRINGYVDDVRVVVGSCPYSASAFVVPTAELTAITNTKLLLKGTSVTKDDSSLNLYTQALGSAASSTVQSKFGGSSIKIASATGDFIKVYNNMQPIALLDRPFTIEGWFWLNATNSSVQQPLINMRNSGRWDGPIIYIESDNTLKALFSNGGTAWDNTIATGFTPSAQAWHHISLVREYTAGPVKLYCDGVLRGTANTTSSIFVNDTIFIGHDPWFVSANQTLNGYVDEVRITLDYCAYNGNFTPAAAPFTDGKNLLLHFDGANNSTTMTDSSTYGKVVTAYNGAVISTSQSKFGGSSAYFPGTNSNRIVISNSTDFAFGTGDFTVEFWANVTAMGAGYGGTDFNYMFDTRSANFSGGIMLNMDQNKKIRAWANNTYLVSGNKPITLNEWTHIALTRKGSNFYIYLNGILDSVGTSSQNLTENGMTIGCHYNYATYGNQLQFNGYIDEFRVTKGTALYAPNPAPATKFSLIGDSTPNQVTALGRTFEISTPSSTATGIPTMDVVSNGIEFFSPVGAANMFFAKDTTNTKTAGQAKTVVASFRYPNSNFGSASFISSIGFKDTISGRYFAFYNSTYANNPTQWGYVTGTSDANGAPVWGTFTRVGNDVNATVNTDFWIKLVDDGTNYITGYFSYDVTNPSWTQAFQVARTGWLTNGSGEVGVVGVADNLSIPCDFILTSWSVT